MMHATSKHSSTARYHAVADRIRSLVPEVRCPGTRRELERLAADYDRLALFIDAMRQASEQSGSTARDSVASQLTAAANDPGMPVAGGAS
jgi:hypothetical protein